ncbi:MAG TPA: hypothetical protein PKD64_13235 [Pirellulaceae bacterium]|nr:hypothetical protein [Pirellulaceae bacterium]HMO93150.1 hypothetical protein [Pirellulaceae bacterium]HMP70020.1 hypothetical protein [Pirellulaceae bacterium]
MSTRQGAINNHSGCRYSFDVNQHALTYDEFQRPSYVTAVLARVIDQYSPNTGFAVTAQPYGNDRYDRWRIQGNRGRLRGFSVEFKTLRPWSNRVNVRIKRHSRVFDVLAVSIGLVPAFLVFILLLIAKLLMTSNEPPMVFILFLAFSVGLMGTALAAVLSGLVSHLSGQAMSTEELTSIGDAVVEAISVLNAEGT